MRELNRKRQDLTTEGLARLEKQLASPKERVQPIYILKDETIDESIAGIIAGRIKGKYHRPCIVLTSGKDGLKGSGRSIDAYNMVEQIRKSEKYLSSFGGHAMACGLSLRKDQFIAFKLDAIEKRFGSQRFDPSCATGYDYAARQGERRHGGAIESPEALRKRKSQTAFRRNRGLCFTVPNFR